MQFLTREKLAAAVREREEGAPLALPVRSLRAFARTQVVATDQELAMVTERLGAPELIGRVVPFCISTGERVDDGLQIDPMGWDTGEYDRVPHVFWQHSWWRSDRGAARIADSVVTKSPDQLSALCAFYPRDLSQALDGGFSWAIGELTFSRGFRASVTFDVVEAALADEATRKTIPWALDVSVARLWEWSICNLGMDWGAISAGRAAGVDTQPIADVAAELLDAGGLRAAIRAEIEAVLAAARTTPAAVVSTPKGAVEIRAAVKDALAPLGGQLPRPAR